MPSRLDELRRQRALLQEHLARLDREIAAEPGESRDPDPAIIPKAAPVRPPAPPPSPAAAAEAEEMLAQFRADEEKNRPPPTKAGCWVIFSLIMLALVGAVGGLAYFIYR